jgi:hypothetical protein
LSSTILAILRNRLVNGHFKDTDAGALSEATAEIRSGTSPFREFMLDALNEARAAVEAGELKQAIREVNLIHNLPMSSSDARTWDENHFLTIELPSYMNQEHAPDRLRAVLVGVGPALHRAASARAAGEAHQEPESGMASMPEYRLHPEPMDDAARAALGFKWADARVGFRHKLGGVPEFQQKVAHPNCPSCSEPMTFYGQIDSIGDDYCLADCGMVFVFVCLDCFESTSLIQSG